MFSNRRVKTLEIEQERLRLCNVEDDASGDESGSDSSAEVCVIEDVVFQTEPELKNSTS